MRVVVSLPWALIALIVAAPSQAAWPTRVMTAVEKDSPLPELWLGVGFEHIRKSAKINREWVQRDQATNEPLLAQDVGDLDFSEYQHRLNLDLRVGIFRDLEVHIRAPIILAYASEISFQPNAEATSTIFGNDGNANNPNFDYR